MMVFPRLGPAGTLTYKTLPTDPYRLLSTWESSVGAGGKRVTFGWIVANHGSVTVCVEWDRETHHSTVRRDARDFVRKSLGDRWEICSYLGTGYYRREDGYDVAAKRFSVVFI